MVYREHYRHRCKLENCLTCNFISYVLICAIGSLNMKSTLQECLKELNWRCCQGKNPTNAQKKNVATFCQKRYIFDLIYAFMHEKKRSINSIKTVVNLFPADEAKWAWLFLCALRLPYRDPTEWDLKVSDYSYFHIMLQLLVKLDMSANEFRNLAEYPLRVSVDALLMSSAFVGCGEKVMKRWRTKEFYRELLSRKTQLVLKSGRYSSVDLAEDFISSVAKLFEKHHMEQLHLGIGTGALYYGLDKTEDARNAFLDWLLKAKVNPFLVDLVLFGFLIPENGLLLPDGKKIREAIDSKETKYHSMLGTVDLAIPLAGLSGILAGKPPSKSAKAHLFVIGYVLWHAELGLRGKLDNYYIEHCQ